VAAALIETRNSSGLGQFCTFLETRPGMTVLDLAGANQATISFITNYGHRLYSDDLLKQLDERFGDRDFYENQLNPLKVADFLDEALNFPEDHFDGVLLWDALQYLSQPVLEAVVDRLWRMMRPGGAMLAFFSATDSAIEVPSYAYRIADHRTIHLQPRGSRRPAQNFNSRTIERMFERFASVKFFLARDQMREVIVRR
jgi:ubiquinone/menaquinone biosynthesis C-methylase UbiE